MYIDLYTSASAIDGMRDSRAVSIQSFKHSDADSLKKELEHIKKRFIDIAEGRRSVFIAMEALYSMDGDSPPVQQIVSAAKDLLPLGNAIFYIDEAHSTGIIGPRGSGFICHHGLEREFAIRVHSE